MSTITTYVTSNQNVPTAARLPVVKAAAVATVVGAVASELVAAAARAAGISMNAALLGASHADTIHVGGFATGTVFNVAIGTVIALMLLRRANKPARTFVRIAIVLTAVSMVLPATAAHTAGATKVTLAVAHLVVAMVVIPAMAHALPTKN
jgi:hypothetical protein